MCLTQRKANWVLRSYKQLAWDSNTQRCVAPSCKVTDECPSCDLFHEPRENKLAVITSPRQRQNKNLARANVQEYFQKRLQRRLAQRWLNFNLFYIISQIIVHGQKSVVKHYTLKRLPGTSSSSSSTVAIGAFPSAAVKTKKFCEKLEEQLRCSRSQKQISSKG